MPDILVIPNLRCLLSISMYATVLHCPIIVWLKTPKFGGTHVCMSLFMAHGCPLVQHAITETIIYCAQWKDHCMLHTLPIIEIGMWYYPDTMSCTCMCVTF